MLSRFYCTCHGYGSATSWLIVMLSVLSACGGGSSGKSASTNSIQASSSSLVTGPIEPNEKVILSGFVTYDLVPHNENHLGLNYNAIVKMPVRGAVVELLDTSDSVIAIGSTNQQGEYSFSVAKNSLLKVRVRAQLLQKESPTWDFTVTDNTNNNAIYVLDGYPNSSGTDHSQRHLHASSGWDGSQYSAVRAAAPFAILDNIYIAASGLSAAGNRSDLKPLQLRWSSKNNSAEGEQNLGEIGTSFFDGSAIYILGDYASDADEYDSHVIVHEWAHYLEQNLFRSDSFGGNHAGNDRLDMRVAMSEGFANAFASMVLNNPYYADSSGVAQRHGFFIDIARRDNMIKGFYSEASIGSIFYNFYTSANNKTVNDFSSIFAVLKDNSYITNAAMTSIFLFYSRFKALFADQAMGFNTLMKEQTIFGSDEYASDETNNAGYAQVLPIYTNVQVNGEAVNVCSSALFGKFNKLANSQLLKLNIVQLNSYTIRVTRSGVAGGGSRPEIIVFKQGERVEYFANAENNFVLGDVTLFSGIYILEIYDANHRDESNTQQNTACFNVQVLAD